MSTGAIFKPASIATAILFSIIFLFFGCSTDKPKDDPSSSSNTVGTRSSGEEPGASSSSLEEQNVLCFVDPDCVDVPADVCSSANGTQVEVCPSVQSSSSESTGDLSSSSSLNEGGESSGSDGEQSSSSLEAENVWCIIGSNCRSVTAANCARFNGEQVEECPAEQSSSSVVGVSSSSSASASSSSVSGSSSSRSSSSSRASSSSSPRSSSSFATIDPRSFTETVNGVSFDMVYIPGGTFTLGCTASSGCPADTKPVEGVTVSNYFIGKAEVTTALYNAVMGITCANTDYMCRAGGSATSITWYDALEFACKLSELTGKNYRMETEAEWEYAAKNHLSSLNNVGSGEEWAYNSWNSTHTGGTDPIGPTGPIHTQKTRRDAQGTADNITGRLIRSIEGVGPALRLAISADVPYPPNMVPTCEIHAPKMEGEPENSYRDPRWITGSDKKWGGGAIAIGTMDLMIWEDGTARWKNLMGRYVEGQWFTSNNIALVLVPPSGTSIKLAYIFLDETQGSVISDQSFMNGGYIGRIIMEDASGVTKPTVSGLKSGAELATAAGNDYKMVDMENIPVSAQKQDPRLLDGLDVGWFQDNRSAGGVHHYRKDVDLDEFRFTVNQGGNRTMLANGKWFTVNNTFLRVTHSNGYTADYLYAVDSDGTFYHNSFMAYERGDFRMFKKVANNSADYAATCGNICSGEIPKGEGASLYANMGETGKSTFVPAKCPSGGCR